MRIIHLLSPAKAGGLERVVQGLSIGQVNRGDEVLVAAVIHEPMARHPFLEPLDRAGVPVRQIIVPHRGYLTERAAVVALCQYFHPDVVHGHGYRPDVVDGGAIRGLGIATVSSIHGATKGPLRNRFYESLHLRLLRRFDAVIAVSDPIGAMLIQTGVRRERVHVIPNGWTELTPSLGRGAARQILGIDPDNRTLGWVGRLSREKGIDVFIQAFAKIDDPRVSACIVGDGPERSAAEMMAASIPGDRIKFAGMVPEAGRLCKAFDLFVLSSRSEGVPISLLEAMASGVPVVAANVGGVPTVVTEREAWLVAPEDPNALASAVKSALANCGDAQLRAGRALTRLETDFGRDAWLQRHEYVYHAARDVRRNAQ